MERSLPDRAEIEALVRGRVVHLRCADGADAEMPGWLAAAAGEVGRSTAAERAALRHPDDHQRVAETWLWLLAHPGEVVELRCRIRLGAGWGGERMRIVNLIDDPSVGGILVATDPVLTPLAGDAWPPGEGEEGVGPVSAPPALPPGSVRAVPTEPFTPARWLTFAVDASFRVRRVQGMPEELLGRAAEDLDGAPLPEVLEQSEMGSTMTAWLDIVDQPDATRVMQVRLRAAGDRTVWLQMALFNRRHADGTPEILVVGHDVTEQRRQQEELRLLADELRLLADEVPSPVFRCDGTGAFSFRNGRWAESAVLDPAAERLHDVVAPADRERVQALLDGLEMGSPPDAGSLEVRSADGRAVLALSLRPVGGPAGRAPAVFVGTVADVTATVALRERADRDAVTGLLSRPALEDRLRAALAGDPRSLLVLFVDLDEFKAVNDTHGHDVGDEVLSEVGRRLRAAVRPGDDVGRYGGDEFVIGYRDAARAPSAELEQRIAAAFAEPVATSAGPWPVRASIGSARPDPGDDLTGLLRRADLAMFAMKRARQTSGEAIILSSEAAGATVDLDAGRGVRR